MDAQRDFSISGSNDLVTARNYSATALDINHIPGFLPTNSSTLTQTYYLSAKNDHPNKAIDGTTGARNAVEVQMKNPHLASRILFNQSASPATECPGVTQFSGSVTKDIAPQQTVPDNEYGLAEPKPLCPREQKAVKTKAVTNGRMPQASKNDCNKEIESLAYQINSSGVEISYGTKKQRFASNSPQYIRISELHKDWKNSVAFRQRMKDNRRTGWRGNEIFSTANQKNIRQHRQRLNDEMRKLIETSGNT